MKTFFWSYASANKQCHLEIEEKQALNRGNTQESEENQEKQENEEKQMLDRGNIPFAFKADTSLYTPILNPFQYISCIPDICNFLIHAKLSPKQSKFVWHIVPHPQKRYFSSIQMKRQNSHHYFKIIQTKKIWFRDMMEYDGIWWDTMRMNCVKVFDCSVASLGGCFNLGEHVKYCLNFWKPTLGHNFLLL